MNRFGQLEQVNPQQLTDANEVCAHIRSVVAKQFSTEVAEAFGYNMAEVLNRKI